MGIPNWLLLVLCFHLALSFRVLKGKDIPKNYTIGKLANVNFAEDKRVFFRTTDNLMGFINRETGVLLAVYELDSDETILTYHGYAPVIIAKQKQLNMFVPKDQSYVQLQYSEYLQKQTFTKIITFKRFMFHEYILTDQFLVRADDPYAYKDQRQENDEDEEEEQTFTIVAKREKGRTLFGLIFLMEKNIENSVVGLVTIKSESENDRKELCIKKMYVARENVKQICTQLDTEDKLLGITEVGQVIAVIYENKKILFNHKLVKTHELKKYDKISFIEELKIIGHPEQGNNLASNSQATTILFINQGNQKGCNNLQYFQRYMLIKKDNQVTTKIAKQSGDIPVSVWAITVQKGSSEFNLIVEYEDKKVVCYKVDQADKSNTVIWSLTVKDPVEYQGGEEKVEGAEVDLEVEEGTLIEGNQQQGQKEEEENKEGEDLSEGKPEKP